MLAASQFRVRLGQPVHRCGIAHDLQGFLEPLQVLWCDQDGQGPAMRGHGHSLVVIVNTADKLGEVRLDVPKREHGHSQKYDQIRRDVER